MLGSEDIAGKRFLKFESVVKLLKEEKEKGNLFTDFPIGATIQDGSKRKRSVSSYFHFISYFHFHFHLFSYFLDLGLRVSITSHIIVTHLSHITIYGHTIMHHTEHCKRSQNNDII